MKRGHLEAVGQAFSELAENKFRYGLLKKVREWSKFLDSEIKEREEMRGQIVKQYLLEEEDSVGVDSPNYAQCLQDLTDLFNEDVEGTPSAIDMADLPDSMELSGHSFAILAEMKVLVEDNAD